MKLASHEEFAVQDDHKRETFPFSEAWREVNIYGPLARQARRRHGDGANFSDQVSVRVIRQSLGLRQIQHMTLRIHERVARSEEHTSELQSLMRISYAVFCLKKKKTKTNNNHNQS